MIAEWFWMDGNGPFVWGAWFVAVALLTVCLAFALYRDRRLARDLEAMTRQKTTAKNR